MYHDRTHSTSVDRLSFGLPAPTRVNEAFVRYCRGDAAHDLREVDRWTHAYVCRYFAVQCARDRRLGEPVCEELIGAALERILRCRGTVRFPERYVGWVRAVCRNLLVDAIRRPRLCTVTWPRDGMVDQATGLSPTGTETWTHAGSVIDSALERLPIYLRAAVRLRVIEERPYAEVQARTGKAIPTLRAYVQRGLCLLRSDLARRRRR